MIQNEHIIGVKNSSMSTYDISLFKSIGKDNVVIFNGSDEQYIAGRMMGAEGGIGGTYGVMPELYICLEKFIANEKIEEAKKLQFEINEIIRKLISGSCMYAYAKEVLKLRGLETGGVRLPFLPFMDKDIPKISAIHHDIMGLVEGYELGVGQK
jgi:N-acetylneuraminate lyase